MTVTNRPFPSYDLAPIRDEIATNTTPYGWQRDRNGVMRYVGSNLDTDYAAELVDAGVMTEVEAGLKPRGRRKKAPEPTAPRRDLEAEKRQRRLEKRRRDQARRRRDRRILALYVDAECPTGEVAEVVGVHPNTVLNVLRAHDVPLRGPKPRMTQQQDAQAARWRSEGVSWRQIARRLRCDIKTAHAAAARGETSYTNEAAA